MSEHKSPPIIHRFMCEICKRPSRSYDEDESRCFVCQSDDEVQGLMDRDMGDS